MESSLSNSEVELAEKVANLTVELQVAKESIQDLQSRLERRESELRTNKEKQERSFRRKTRQRKASGLLNTSFKVKSNIKEDFQLTDEPLNGCLLLTICGYSRERTSHHDILGSENTFSNSPTFIHMLSGMMFVVGPEGAAIGSGSGCGVNLPSTAGIRRCHGCIKSQINATNGNVDFFFYKVMPSRHHKFFDDEPEIISSTEMNLQNGSMFLTGNIKWRVSAVPLQHYLPSKAFTAIRRRSTDDFMKCLNEINDWNEDIRKRIHDATNSDYKESLLQKQIDLCVVEDFNYTICTNNYKNDGMQAQNVKFTSLTKDNQYSLLHVAIDHDKREIVEKLLESGLSVNMQCGSQKYTPLHLACKNENFELVKLLLKFGASVDVKDNNYEMPINITEDFQIRKLLLRASLFCSACGEGDLSTAQYILNEEPNCLDARAYRDYTPLQLASFYGHENVVKFLLDNKASLYLTDNQYKRSALHFAVLIDNVTIARLLLEHGLDPSLVDVFGYTAKHFCQSKEMLHLLCGEDVIPTITLGSAVQIGDEELVGHLLEENQKGNIPNSLPSNILQKLSSNRQHVRKTSRHAAMNNLGLTALVDQKNDRGMGPIHLAAAAGKIDTLQLLYNYGGSLNNPGGIEKWTPLFYASLCGRHQCVEYLLSLGALPEQCDSRGQHCIDLVEKEINSLKVKLKIDSANPSVQSTLDGDNVETSLQSLIPPQYLLQTDRPCIDFRAEPCLRSRLKALSHVLECLRSNQQKLLKLLKNEDEEGLHRLLSDVDVNLNVPLSKSLPITPLNYAASLGLEKITEILLTYNADPYVADNQSYMPIHTAAESGHEQVVRTLLQDGVDVNVQTELQKSTALHIAVVKNHTSVVECLLQVEGIKISLTDRNGNKPFDLATDKTIQYLLGQGEELLCLAVFYNDTEKLKSFCDTGVFVVNEILHDGIGLLHVAATRNHEESARILIENGVDVNSVASRNKETPLHCACYNSSSSVVKLLLENKADLTIEDINGHTPFEVTQTNDIRKLIILYSQSRLQAASEEEPHSTLSSSSAHNHEEDDRNANADADDVGKCRICLVNVVNTIVLPCGHQQFCAECVLKIDTCSLDRRRIQNIVFNSLIKQ